MSKLTKIRLIVVSAAAIMMLSFQFLDSGLDGLIQGLPYYGLLIGVIVLVLVVQYLWRKIFCRGAKSGDGMRFELSGFAEGVLHTWNFAFIAAAVYALSTSTMSWYEYILPVLMCLLPIASSFNYFANRKDFIELAPGKATFMDQDKLASVEFANYEFYKAESDAISTSFSKANTWHLKLMGRGKAQIFDLKDMNLNGHKNAMERYLKSITAKQS